MSRTTWSICLLVALLGNGPAMAWGPYGPSPWSGYPEPPPGMETFGPGFPFADRHPGGSETPVLRPRQAVPPDALPPTPGYPGYGPRTPSFRGYSSPTSRSHGRPTRLRLSRITTDDAYLLTIEADGLDPNSVRIHTQGRWLLVRRTHTTQTVRSQDSGDRGFTRRFSYSSGTVSRRLAVPGDAILNAMSREDGEDSVRIRIPRRGSPQASLE